MAPRSTSGRVRPFVEADVPQVAEVHRTVFRVPEGDGASPGDEAPSRRLSQAYEEYFSEVFLHGPWRDEGIGPLVYEDGDGRIAGFLGVVPKRMSLRGRTVRAAVCSQFVVHPRKRGLVGLRLLKEHFQGPQDLSFTDEANHASRRLWEARGAGTCPLYSLRWIRPLRPARLVVSALRRRRGFGVLGRAGAPLAPIADAAAARWMPEPLRCPRPRGAAEDLTEEALLHELSGLSTRHSLHPCYDRRSLRWTLGRAKDRGAAARLHTVAVRDPDRRTAGWFVYTEDGSKVGEVLQIGARLGWLDAVYAHLLQHASRGGAIALVGRAEPPFVSELSDRGCLFHRGGPLMLLHAKRAEVLDPIYRGEAFLSRLEGEWCLRFRP